VTGSALMAREVRLLCTGSWSAIGVAADKQKGSSASQNRPRAGLFRVKLLMAGPFWTAVTERSDVTALASAEADGLASASRPAKAVAPSGGCRTLPPQSKILPAWILGQATIRALSTDARPLASDVAADRDIVREDPPCAHERRLKFQVRCGRGSSCSAEA
jgi:hypothetical protein